MDWEVFWSNYRNIKSTEDNDLFFQVGKTINSERVSNEIFVNMVEDIVTVLNLSKDDDLLELCCGNGLISKPLSEICGKLYGFDFTSHLISTANQMRSNANIIYATGDAKSDFFSLFKFDIIPKKYLMNDSLAYFEPHELKNILSLISSYTNNYFSFYITGVPADKLKWNFYDTSERKENYQQNLSAGDISNKGMGRWWTDFEFTTIANELELKVSLTNQINNISNYRINVLFEKR